MTVQLHTIGMIVNNLAQSLAFYRLLGLPIPELPEADESNFEFKTPDGITLGFLTEETAQMADPTWQKPTGQRLNLQFRFDSSAEVDATYHQLIEAGYESHAAPWDAYWGQRFARVKDPDGSIVNLFAEL
jgi:uncharacterized glyoxalase superfamily protein PhnB